MSFARAIGFYVFASFLIGAPGALAAPPEAPDNPYAPPACAGVFADVPCPGGFAVNWIEQLYNNGISAGCGGGNYCPDNPVTRAQMAVFVEKAMHGTSGWTPGDLGNGNTGLGAGSLPFGTTGNANTGVGFDSLTADTTGYDNTGVGILTLASNSGGDGNTAIGSHSLYLTTATGNTAVGYYSLVSNASGTYNAALGYMAAVQNDNLTDATAIGAFAIADASYHVRIGDSAVTQIGGQVGWSNLSDARAKNDIRDLDLGLDFVLALRPVSFTMKSGNGRTDMGFVAQDVEGLLGDEYNVLGIGGDRDRTLSLRYTDLIAPMVKAIQEQQAQLSAKDARITGLEKEQAAEKALIAARDAKIARLENGLDEVRAQLRALAVAERPGGGGSQP